MLLTYKVAAVGREKEYAEFVTDACNYEWQWLEPEAVEREAQAEASQFDKYQAVGMTLDLTPEYEHNSRILTAWIWAAGEAKRRGSPATEWSRSDREQIMLDVWNATGGDKREPRHRVASIPMKQPLPAAAEMVKALAGDRGDSMLIDAMPEVWREHDKALAGELMFRPDYDIMADVCRAIKQYESENIHAEKSSK